MNKKPRREQDEVDYWRSMVDIFIGLLLVILLTMSLLMMGVIDRTNGQHSFTGVEASPVPTVTPTPTASPTPIVTPTPSPTPVPADWYGGAGGGGGNHSYTPTPVPTATPFWSEETRSAVRVLVCDGETGNPLAKSGIDFTLSSEEEKSLVLRVFYPEVKRFSRFSTTSSGTFYLPEKLEPGAYTLHNVAIPTDYDTPEDVAFVLEGKHDWTDPEVITVPVFPCRGTIALTVTDADTGKPVPGGIYEIVASEKVTTSDGTVRYMQGETADRISCDDEGNGMSQELILGSFYVHQKEAPFGYAAAEDTEPLKLEKKQKNAEPGKVSFRLERTSIGITVRDGARLNRLAGVRFTVNSKAGRVSAVTDENGEITLVDLLKNTDYTISQSEDFGDYIADGNTYTFHVDENGRIDGEAHAELTISENVVRCAFSVTGLLIRSEVAGQNSAVFDASGAIVKEWYSDEKETEIDGLKPGIYTYSAGGKQMQIEIANTSELQHFAVRILQTNDILIIAGAAAVIFGAVFLAVVLKKRKKDE